MVQLRGWWSLRLHSAGKVRRPSCSTRNLGVRHLGIWTQKMNPWYSTYCNMVHHGPVRNQDFVWLFHLGGMWWSRIDYVIMINTGFLQGFSIWTGLRSLKWSNNWGPSIPWNTLAYVRDTRQYQMHFPNLAMLFGSDTVWHYIIIYNYTCRSCMSMHIIHAYDCL